MRGRPRRRSPVDSGNASCGFGGVLSILRSTASSCCEETVGMIPSIPDFLLRDSLKAEAGMSDEARAQQDQVHKAVGLLFAVWANIETRLIALVSRLVNVDRKNARIIFFSLTTNRAKMNLVRALCQANLKGERLKAALKLVDRFKAPTRLRNELAHSEYSLDPATYFYKGTYSLDMERETVPIDKLKPFNAARMNEITNVTKNLLKLGDDIWRLCSDMDKEQPSTPAEAAREDQQGQ